MGFDFPSSPTVGQIYPVTPVAGLPSYRWDGEKWGPVTNVNKPIIYADGSVAMTAQLTVVNPPVNPTDAAAKGYVDGKTFALAGKAAAEAGTDATMAMTARGVSQAILANALSFKNIAGRNGGFEVWQSLLNTGVSTIAVAASTTKYTVDGWYASTQAGASYTVSKQAGLTNGSNASVRIQRDSGQTGVGVMQFGFPLDIDEIKKLAGQTVTLSFVASTGANWSPASGSFNFYLLYGSGGTLIKYATGSGSWVGAVALFGGQALAAGSAATAFFSAPVAVPANTTQAEVYVSWTPAGTAGANDWIQFDDVDLRITPAGLTATSPSFERSDYVFDLLRCQRHYYRRAASGTQDLIGMLTAQSGAICWGPLFPFPVPMRRVPTMTVSSPGHFSCSPTGGPFTGFTLDGSSQNSCGSYTSCTVTNVLTTGWALGVWANNASGWFDADARI